MARELVGALDKDGGKSQVFRVKCAPRWEKQDRTRVRKVLAVLWNDHDSRRYEKN